MSVSLTTKLVFDGAMLDVEGSVNSFRSELARFQTERETEEDTIAEAVSAQFDAYPGQPQPMPALVNGVLNRLQVQPASHKSMTDKVQAYIRDNADRQADKNKGIEAEASRTRLFGIKKGVGGGVCRWSDVPHK